MSMCCRETRCYWSTGSSASSCWWRRCISRRSSSTCVRSLHENSLQESLGGSVPDKVRRARRASPRARGVSGAPQRGSRRQKVRVELEH
jgi:hypothetical protein